MATCNVGIIQNGSTAVSESQMDAESAESVECTLYTEVRSKLDHGRERHGRPVVHESSCDSEQLFVRQDIEIRD